MTEAKKWTKESLLAMLDVSDKAVAKALLVLYGFQTADEQAAGYTAEENGKGFNGSDAEFLTNIAKWVIAHDGHITPGQADKVRQKIRKYWKQLLTVANENERSKVARVDG